MSLLFFLLGLGLLLVGGRMLVAASIDIAQRLHVPSLLIGLTLVAWGTSAPELAFNLTAAIQGKGELVFGNVVGASIYNLGLVLGLCSLIAPLAVHTSVVRREIPLMLGLFVIFAISRAMPALDEIAGGRLRPVILLLIFAGYSAFVIHEGWVQRRADQELTRQVEQTKIVAGIRPVWQIVIMFIGGLALLGAGGNIAADAASAIARSLGMSDRVVGLTVVSLGTTLPELVTSITAIRKKQVDLAVGNAVGSCVFNIGAIAALCGLVRPAPLPDGGELTLLVLLVLGVLLIPMSRTFKGHVARIEGVILLLIQATYIGYELWRTRV